MIYGYARCSTSEERQDIYRQVRELEGLGVNRENIYMEYESGAKADRIELNRLIDKLQTGDVIVTTEVSRITRSTKQLCEILELVRKLRVKLIIGTFVVDCREGDLDVMTEGMLKMMGVFAELERNMISSRVKSGMANAREKGKKIGRPATSSGDIPTIFLKHYPKYKSEAINITEFARLCSMSRTTVYKYIKILEVN